LSFLRIPETVGARGRRGRGTTGTSHATPSTYRKKKAIAAAVLLSKKRERRGGLGKMIGKGKSRGLEARLHEEDLGKDEERLIWHTEGPN